MVGFRPVITNNPITFVIAKMGTSLQLAYKENGELFAKLWKEYFPTSATECTRAPERLLTTMSRMSGNPPLIGWKLVDSP